MVAEEIDDGVVLDATLVEAFGGTFLSPGYDDAKPTPDLHREMWIECCSDDPWVALAAPRGHAKSTSVTHAFVLASVLLGEKKFVLVIM